MKPGEFILGYSSFGNYKLWITTPVFTVDMDDPKAALLHYFEVNLTHHKGGFDFYVDPTKEEFLNLNLSDRNPLIKPRDKENLNAEEQEFIVEYRTYLDRKYMLQPLTKLSKRHVLQLVEILRTKKTGDDIATIKTLVMDETAVNKFLVPGSEVMLRTLADSLEPIGEVGHEIGWKSETWNPDFIKQHVLDWLSKKNLTLKQVAPSARVAITGRSESPGLFECIWIIGKAEAMGRLYYAAEFVENKSK